MHHSTYFQLALYLPFLYSFTVSQTQATEVCKPGSFLDGTECRLCPPGTYSSEPDSIKCTLCPRRTFNPNAGAQGYDLCSPCPSGTFNNLHGQSNCKPCPPGTNSTLQADNCRGCPAGRRNAPFTSLCEPCDGKSITIRAGLAICDPCPPNHASDATGTKCLPCPPGQRIVKKGGSGPKTQFICHVCPGFSINDGSFEKCQNCPPGHGANRDRTKCVMCYPGTARLSFYKGCVKCPAGENVGVRGSSLCLPPKTQCPSNFFQIKEGGCLTCHRGQRFDPSINRCINCGENEESDGGLSTECRPCNLFQTGSPRGCVCRPGAEFVNNSFCRLCPVGHTKNPNRGRICTLCPRGTFAAKEGSAECTKCPAGMVSKANRAECTSCSVGEVFKFSLLRKPGYEGSNVRSNADRIADDYGVCVDPLTNCPKDTDRVGSPSKFSRHSFDGLHGICRPKEPTRISL